MNTELYGCFETSSQFFIPKLIHSSELIDAHTIYRIYERTENGNFCHLDKKTKNFNNFLYVFVRYFEAKPCVDILNVFGPLRFEN